MVKTTILFLQCIQQVFGMSSYIQHVRATRLGNNLLARKHWLTGLIFMPSLVYFSVFIRAVNLVHYSLPKDTPVSGSLMGWGGRIFKSCSIPLKKATPISHAISLALFIICSHAKILQCLLSFACLCKNSKWQLPSFVSPSSCTVLLLWWFLLKITTCTAA